MWYKLSMPVIECVPNVSEGRRTEVIERACGRHSTGTPSVRLLDHSSDASHNRSVLTMVGDAASLKAAVVALFDAALPRIDLRTQTGEHPRLGAVDVVPFVPIEGVTHGGLRAAGKRDRSRGRRTVQVPVYLYEEASDNPARRNLEDIRRGEFEGFEAKMSSPGWAPDYGAARPHPTAGARSSAHACRSSPTTSTWRPIAWTSPRRLPPPIRFSSGGFRYVKAMGVALEERGIVQVSMNLTNYERTPMFRVFEAVKREAERYGVAVLESEIVGLVPAAALVGTAEHFLQLTSFTPNQVLENRLRETS